ncbi:MAG: tripartite tricarboxylate transporter substrate binding protein [Betaproteobacteria bacterium]|nr:tripartite tricarboxylate transporter substrate binding protein [Betaproteobacteria bacterium]
MSRCHRAVFYFVPAVILAGLSGGARISCAQPYPAKSVRVIVPFPASSGADVVFRIFTPRLTEVTGQPFVAENRAGAAGNIGAEAVARAIPDGYTLLVAPASLASSQSMVKNLPFDLLRDFEPIAFLASLPFMLVVHPALPVQSLKELIALAKSRPGEINYGSSGTGGASHLSGELFKSMSAINVIHVPYKGGIAAMPDLIGGRISMMITGIADVLPHVRAGQLRALGVASVKRSQVAPDLPTIAESGLPGYEAGSWFALLAPANTPRIVISQMNGVVNKIGQSADVRDSLRNQGAEPQVYTPEQLGAFIKNEIARWGALVAATGIRAE